jgi:hypothetical protein
MKIPCKNCVCFPVCKSQAIMEKFGGGRYIRIDILHKKCKVFVKWYDSRIIRCSITKEVRECFNVSYATWRIPGRWYQ